MLSRYILSTPRTPQPFSVKRQVRSILGFKGHIGSFTNIQQLYHQNVKAVTDNRQCVTAVYKNRPQLDVANRPPFADPRSILIGPALSPLNSVHYSGDTDVQISILL